MIAAVASQSSILHMLILITSPEKVKNRQTEEIKGVFEFISLELSDYFLSKYAFYKSASTNQSHDECLTGLYFPIYCPYVEDKK